MTIIAADALGPYLAVTADAYVGGKFVSDVIAPVAMFDPAVLLLAVPLLLAAGPDVSALVEPTPVPLPSGALLLLGALAAPGWRR